VIAVLTHFVDSNSGSPPSSIFRYDQYYEKLVLAGRCRAYAFRWVRELQRGPMRRGIDSNRQYLDDTWVFDGSSWVRSPSTSTPSARWNHSLVYDPILAKLILFGGRNNDGSLNDTWTYGGKSQQWAPLATLVSPSERASSQASYLGKLRSMFVFGGFASDNNNRQGPAKDMWRLSVSRVAGAESCDAADGDSDHDGLIGCDDPDCFALCRPLCLPYSSCDRTPGVSSQQQLVTSGVLQGQPYCGDGVCNRALETAALCPTDDC
jgi:hypothetical protein